MDEGLERAIAEDAGLNLIHSYFLDGHLTWTDMLTMMVRYLHQCKQDATKELIRIHERGLPPIIINASNKGEPGELLMQAGTQAPDAGSSDELPLVQESGEADVRRVIRDFTIHRKPEGGE